MSTDFLLELLSEEIPARMQEKASADLQRLFETEIAKAGLAAQAIETYATPRRLALIARGLPAATQAVSEETKGPKSSAPPQALEGFLRKTGLTREQLVERDGVLFAIVEKPGRPTTHVLHNAIQAIVHNFPWPKSMRWGAASSSSSSLRWVRPLRGIVAIFGDEVLNGAIEVGGDQKVPYGATTYGHRFHHPGPITIGSVKDYAEKLRACHVILDPAERRGIIEGGARALAEARGLSVIPDAGLVAENAGLTEWPVPLLGDFDPAFLEVPREVIQLTMRTNQKYFACVDKAGKLAPNFICTANIVAEDGGAAIVAGNRKVLAARLSDAKFFWEQDLRVPLAEQAKKLDQIVFHEKLGTVKYRADLATGLAIWLLGRGYLTGFDEEHITLAAPLAKADLVTGTVGEFPELQAIIGSRIAEHQGFLPAICDAIRDQYKPVGPSDDVPRQPLAIGLALSDKLETLCGFFSQGLVPTGSSDPFALRRMALGVIRIILENGLRIPLQNVIAVEMTAVFFARVEAFAKSEREEIKGLLEKVKSYIRDESAAAEGLYDDRFLSFANSLVPEYKAAIVASDKLMNFFADRLKVQQREAGVRHDLIDAVFALGGEDDLVRLLARVKALQGFVSTEDGANLLAGYKRAANILRKEGWDQAPSPPRGEGWGEGERGGAERQASDGGHPHPTLSLKGEGLKYAPEPAESALIAALDAAESAADAAVKDENFEAAMAALASLRGPIDAFFDSVTVNDADPVKREARLELLARIRGAVHRVADFSKIEG